MRTPMTFVPIEPLEGWTPPLAFNFEGFTATHVGRELGGLVKMMPKSGGSTCTHVWESL